MVFLVTLHGITGIHMEKSSQISSGKSWVFNIFKFTSFCNKAEDHAKLVDVYVGFSWAK